MPYDLQELAEGGSGEANDRLTVELPDMPAGAGRRKIW